MPVVDVGPVVWAVGAAGGGAVGAAGGGAGAVLGFVAGGGAAAEFAGGAESFELGWLDGGAGSPKVALVSDGAVPTCDGWSSEVGPPTWCESSGTDGADGAWFGTGAAWLGDPWALVGDSGDAPPGDCATGCGVSARVGEVSDGVEV